MPNRICAVCNTEVLAATDFAKRVLCASCRSASMFDALPAWAGHGMLPGAHQMMGDDDDEDGGDDDEEEDEPKPKKGKGKGDDDDGGKFSEKPSKGKPGKGKPSDDDDDDDDDDRPRKKPAPEGGGMSTGLIIGGIAAFLLCCVCVPVGGGLSVMFLSNDLIPAAGRQQAINNAKQIAIAEHSHHDTFKTLASPRFDKAELSWRVAMLPFIEQGPMFNQFDKNADWNKGPNQGLLNARPNVYDCPTRSPADRTQTPWQYFTGEKTMWPTPTSKMTLMGVTDGTSNTFLFAQAETPVPWSKPADIAVQPNGPIGVPQGSFIAAFGDGSARVIDRKRLDDSKLRLLIDPKDNQAINFDF